MSVLGAATTIATAVKTASIINPVKLAGNVGEFARDMSSKSVMEATKSTRIESLTMVCGRAAVHADIDDILSCCLNLLASTYGMALGLNTVADARVIGTLDKINPNRSIVNAVTSSRWLTAFSTEDDTTVYGLVDDETVDPLSTEANIRLKSDTGPHMDRESNRSLVGTDASLSLGKMFAIDVPDSNGRTHPLHINIRLLTNVIPVRDFVSILSHNVTEMTNMDRYHAWRSGEIDFIKGFLLCQDLIDEHKRLLREDKTGIYAAKNETRRKNKAAGILSGNPGIGQLSSLVVMTKDTLRSLEAKGRFKMDVFNQRERFLEENLAMIIAVIDEDYGVVDFYYQSVPRHNTVSISDIKQSNRRKGGPDVLSVLNALKDVKAPSF